MAKLAASEAAWNAANAAVMTLGSYGYSREYPVEKWLRDAKLEEIYEGTSDIQRLIIARVVVPSRALGATPARSAAASSSSSGEAAAFVSKRSMCFVA